MENCVRDNAATQR